MEKCNLSKEQLMVGDCFYAKSPNAHYYYRITSIGDVNIYFESVNIIGNRLIHNENVAVRLNIFQKAQRIDPREYDFFKSLINKSEEERDRITDTLYMIMMIIKNARI